MGKNVAVKKRRKTFCKKKKAGKFIAENQFPAACFVNCKSVEITPFPFLNLVHILFDALRSLMAKLIPCLAFAP
jgi:hypothetical protein